MELNAYSWPGGIFSQDLWGIQAQWGSRDAMHDLPVTNTVIIRARLTAFHGALSLYTL